MAPSCIPGGSSYAVEIPRAIREITVFVLILSSRAQSSQWVSREVDLAINEGKIVLPFVIENCVLKDDFNFYLTNVQCYPAYENKRTAVEKMIEEIKGILSNNINDDQEIKEMSLEESLAIEDTTTFPAEIKCKYEMKSIFSLVFGVVSMIAMLGMSIIFNIVAIVLSILSIKAIKQKKQAGKGLAITGQVLGLVSMVIGLSSWFGGIGFAFALVIDVVSLIIFIKQYKLI